MSKKKHEWTRKGVTASMAVVLAFGMVPAVPGVALATTETVAADSVGGTPDETTSSSGVDGTAGAGDSETQESVKVSDASGLINAVNSAAMSGSPTVIQIDADTIELSVRLDLEEGVTLKGKDTGTTLKFSGNNHYVNATEGIDGGTVCLENITIDVSASGCQNMAINQTNADVTLNKCVLKGNVENNTHGTNTHGESLLTLNDTIIQDMYVAIAIQDQTASTDGVYEYTGAEVRMTNVTVGDCDFEYQMYYPGAANQGNDGGYYKDYESLVAGVGQPRVDRVFTDKAIEIVYSENQLKEAISEVENGTTIYLGKDIDLSETLQVDEDASFAIDGSKPDSGRYCITGNGFNTSVNNIDGIVISAGKVTFENVDFKGFASNPGAPYGSVVEVARHSADGTKLTMKNVNISEFVRDAITIYEGEFDLDEVNIDCKPVEGDENVLTKGIQIGFSCPEAEGASLDSYKAKGVIRDVVVESATSNYKEWGSAAVEVYNNAEVEFRGLKTDHLSNGVIIENYYGGSYTGYEQYSGDSKVSFYDGCVINASNYAIAVDGSDEPKRSSKTEIFGGDFNGGIYVGYGDFDNWQADWTEGLSEKDSLIAYGGSFSVDPGDFVPSGYVVSQSGDKYVVTRYVAPPVPTPSEPEGEVTENPDGSTTTTVTEEKENADGSTVTTVTETTEGREDGSVTEKVTETTVSEDGTKTEKVTETNRLEDGTSATTVAVDGALASVEATVTEAAVESAAGKAVELPMAPVEAAPSEKAVEIEVQAPAGAKVAVPVAKAEGASSVAPGAVLVLVDAEGNETVLPKTANDGSSLSAEIPGDCALKVVDASASFPDVASDDWYEEQGVADFISARGIMTGVEVAPGSFEFQGDEPTNRGMFVTMLNRLEMEAKASSGEGFADVDPGSWYAGSSAWAVEAGIATGYLDAEGNATFDGEGFVTREQMATFLFRYAQWLGLDTSARAEGEIEGVSDFAKDAVSWVVAEGLIKGDDTTGAIRPGDGATRAEAAAVVMRMVELMA